LKPIPKNSLEIIDMKDLILTNIAVFYDNLIYIENKLGKINKQSIFKNIEAIPEYKK
jgi:hypothetical protein